MFNDFKIWLKKFYRWEFWPSYVFYSPIVLFYFLNGIIARDFFFFKKINTSIKMTGFYEDKMKLISRFSKDLIPKFVFYKKGNDPEIFLQKIREKKITFPFILKPNVGARGHGKNFVNVEKIKTEKDFFDYFSKVNEDILAQEFIDFPLEFGVFYIRQPQEKTGKIVSLMQRHFLTMIGDGEKNLKTLIKKHPRARFYQKILFAKLKNNLDNIFLKGEIKILEEIGSHCRGTSFCNCNDKINKDLTESFDKISKQIPDFFYGRYDVKAKTLEDLYKGKVKILELNTWYSDPNHIYDENYSLLKAYKDYWYIISEMRKISQFNSSNLIK